MSKILVPTDFSPSAEKAYPVAASIAKKYGATVQLYHISSNYLELLNAIDYKIGSSITAQFLQKEIEEVKALEVKLKVVGSLPVFSGVNVETEVSELGDAEPSEKIVAFLNKKEHAMIVMGTSGTKGFSDSNAETVARYTEIPLITVKEEVSAFEPKKIVWATDFRTINQKLCDEVLRFKEKYQAEVDMVYVNTAKNFKDSVYTDREAKRIENRYRLKGVNFVVHNSHDVEKGIFEYAKKSNADMIVIATQGLTGFSLFLYNSFTEDIINNSPIPVYSFNMKPYANNDVRSGVVRGFTG